MDELREELDQTLTEFSDEAFEAVFRDLPDDADLGSST
jgi:hypothetical protein